MPTISSAQKVQLVDPSTNDSFVLGQTPNGAGSIATAQVSVATTATQIAAARTGRKAITVVNVTGAQQVYVGGAGVTTTTGVLLPAAIGASITIPFSGALFGIAVTAAQTVSVLETYT